MFPCIIGINEKFVNLNAVALIEDQSTDTETVARIITQTGDEIDLTAEDAKSCLTEPN